MGIAVPTETILRLFNVMQTRPVQGKSYIMYNFVLLESENPWLAELNVEAINDALSAKEASFEAALQSGQFWHEETSRKLELSLEIHRVAWLSLDDALRGAFTSMNDTLTFVNE